MIAEMSWMRRLRVWCETVPVTIVVWSGMVLAWWWLLDRDEASRRALARSGVNVEPSGLLNSLPFWLLIVAYYLAGDREPAGTLLE
jgi:hypothetical protein